MIDSNLARRSDLHAAHRSREIGRGVKLEVSGSDLWTVERIDRRGAVIGAAHRDVVEVEHADAVTRRRNVPSETKMRELGGAGAAVSVAANAELPSGAFSNDKLFVAYITKAITKVGEKRSVWLAKVG